MLQASNHHPVTSHSLPYELMALTVVLHFCLKVSELQPVVLRAWLSSLHSPIVGSSELTAQPYCGPIRGTAQPYCGLTRGTAQPYRGLIKV